jgi:KTSC domain
MSASCGSEEGAVASAEPNIWRGGIMDMQRLNGGSLRAAGYDERGRKLVIELTSGTYEYLGVPSEVWRRFSGASSPWSYFRDNIEEEYTAKRLR